MAGNLCNKTWGVHHVKIVTHRIEYLTELFIQRFVFVPVFYSTSDSAVVVQRGKARFLINQIKADDDCQEEGIADIALYSNFVDEIVNRIVEHGGSLICEPVTEDDENGFIRKATANSCVPHLAHTLLDVSAYHGPFLPGFRKAQHREKSVSVPSSFERLQFDHFAIACEEGESEAIIGWYKRCFKMQRFPVTSTSSLDEELILRHGSTGMCMKVLNYWRCLESGIRSTNLPEDEFKFVIAEPLAFSGPSQITTFLKENNGPGIQHIALLTDDIISVADTMKDAGVSFLRPPELYYEEISELLMKNGRDKVTRNINLDFLKQSGILIDIEEANCQTKNNLETDSKDDSVLYQIFTKPLFDKNTFFMELIQRNGALGFGTANIKALWRAVSIYMGDQSMRINNVS